MKLQVMIKVKEGEEEQGIPAVTESLGGTAQLILEEWHCHKDGAAAQNREQAFCSHCSFLITL